MAKTPEQMWHETDMKIDAENRAKQLALAHWQYVESVSQFHYITAFEHGFKHGFDDGFKDGVELAKHSAKGN
ncbi:hypothetical protein HUU62_08855 [Rhodoferax sp. 4810]|uniref:Uncharacterized protein n=1 Tax=Thiospirillum jenense TaxID=1653858 RepID=A0A839HE98_9GAMM|nr:hypothetical protein [Thiospirillum jenense]MBB1074519.1 hypothetical protein [Rhodoferax jenense]MBB1125497.1 hypothetical protein [Thiospirillum jenense]